MTAVAAAPAVEDDVLSLDASSMSEEDTDDVEQADADATNSSSTEWHFTPADAKLLVRLVKMCQKMGYGGLRGTWKDYLKVCRPCTAFSNHNLLHYVPSCSREPWCCLTCSCAAPSSQSLDITTAADPARHSWNVLADFVDSLTGAEARRAVQKLVNWDHKLQVQGLVAERWQIAICRAASPYAW